jgi:HlyD family secretion protein
MKNLCLILCIGLLTGGCQSNAKKEILQGKVKRDALTIVSKYPGRILAHYAEEGQSVKKGDTLALLDMPEIEAKMAQAQGAVNAARAQYEMALTGATSNELAQISAKLDAVTEQYKFAEKSYNRINAMHQDSLISDQKYDEVHMKYLGAKAQLDGVQAKYNEIKSGVRNEKIRMSMGTYERAKGALQEAMVAYNERFITAPQDMSIETLALKDGELALPGYGIITGYLFNSTYFRFTVPESKIMKYEVGESFVVNSPFSKTDHEAKLVTIKQLTRYADITSAFPDYQLGESIYELKLVPVDEDKANDLYANITVLLP